MKTFTYNRTEKLKHRKLMAQLFSKGRSFSVPPVKVIFLQPQGKLEHPVQVAVGAATRHFKKAVQRNRIKRLLREAYRTEKNSLHEFLRRQNKQVIVFLLYTDKQLPQFTLLKAKMPVILQKLIHALHEDAAPHT